MKFRAFLKRPDLFNCSSSQDKKMVESLHGSKFTKLIHRYYASTTSCIPMVIYQGLSLVVSGFRLQKIKMQLTYDVFTSHMHEAADYIKNIIGKKVDIAVVLGSGLSGFADRMFSTGYTEIDYERVPFMAKTSVSGHSGKVLVGEMGDKTILCFSGRFHSYEGYTPPTLTIFPYVACYLGARIYIVTNAAGGTKRGMEAGCLMLINDQMSLLRWNPLYGYESCQLQHDPDCLLELENLKALLGYLKTPGLFHYPSSIPNANIYSAELCSLVRELAKDKAFIDKTSIMLKGHKHMVKVYEGTYVLNSGPHYETQIDTETIMSLGPGAVGMSSIPEALCARLLGMHVIGLSVVTNLAAGLSKETLDHADVKLVGDAVSTAVYALIEALIARVNIPRLPLLSRYTPKVQDTPIVPATESLPSAEDVKEILNDVPGLSKLRFCLFISSSIFFVKPMDTCLVVGVPLNLSLRKIVAVFEASMELGISVFLILDRTLMHPGLVRLENIMNFTSVHGACLVELEGRGQPLFNGSAYKYLSSLANNTFLLVVESLENPASTYITAMLSKTTMTAVTNAFHFGLVAVARALGLKNLFVGSAQQLLEICSDPRFVSILSTATKVSITHSLVKKYEFSLFDNIQQLKYEHVGRVANEIKTYVIADFKNAILIDSVKNRVDLSSYRRLSVSSPLDIYFDVRTGILIFVVPSICNKVSLQETTFPARLCQVLGVQRVILITDQVQTKDIYCATDVYNVSCVNALRGHNDDRWGARFIDVSGICNKGLSMNLQRLGCRSAIATLTCSPLCVLTVFPYAHRQGFIVVASGCLLSMFELSQARIVAGAIMGPDQQQLFNIARRCINENTI